MTDQRLPARAAVVLFGVRVEQVLAILTDGLVYAAYLFVAAVGLTLIFGVMKIVNVTHGTFYAFGAYAAASITGALARARACRRSLSYAVLLGWRCW